MGRKLDMLLGRKSRQMVQLKSLLSLTVSRLAALRHRRQARCDQARADVAQLLQLGHVDRALLRVEHVIKEQNMLDVFAMLEHYCHLLTERAVLLEHKECPEELREAIASLIFAASRCGELPELEKVRGIFSSNYGKEFVSAAVELRNDCRVNPKMIQKLSTRQPSLEIRQRVTKEIAADKGIRLEYHDPSSEIAEGNSITITTMDLSRDHFLSDESLPTKSHGHQKYKDVAGAAQAAFESAALAAAAARAAVELCRSDSQGKSSDDDNKAGNPKKSKTRESNTTNVETSADSKILENIHHDQYYISDSDEEVTTPKQNDSLHKETVKQPEIPFALSSDASDEEDTVSPNEQDSAGSRGKNILFDKSDNDEIERHRRLRRKPLYARDEEPSAGCKNNGDGVQVQRQFGASLEAGSVDKHQTSYLRPPYRRGNEARYGGKNNSLHEDTNKVGLRSRAENNNAENTYQDSADKMRPPHLSSGKKRISVRTQRGL